MIICPNCGAVLEEDECKPIEKTIYYQCKKCGKKELEFYYIQISDKSLIDYLKNHLNLRIQEMSNKVKISLNYDGEEITSDTI